MSKAVGSNGPSIPSFGSSWSGGFGSAKSLQELLIVRQAELRSKHVGPGTPGSFCGTFPAFERCGRRFSGGRQEQDSHVPCLPRTVDACGSTAGAAAVIASGPACCHELNDRNGASSASRKATQSGLPSRTRRKHLAGGSSFEDEGGVPPGKLSGAVQERDARPHRQASARIGRCSSRRISKYLAPPMWRLFPARRAWRQKRSSHLPRRQPCKRRWRPRWSGSGRREPSRSCPIHRSIRRPSTADSEPRGPSGSSRRRRSRRRRSRRRNPISRRCRRYPPRCRNTPSVPPLRRRKRRQLHGNVTIIRPRDKTLQEPGAGRPVPAAAALSDGDRAHATVSRERRGAALRPTDNAWPRYPKLLARIRLLQAEAERARQREAAAAIRWIKRDIVLYGLTAEDLGFH